MGNFFDAIDIGWDYKKIKANLVEAGVTPHLNLFYSIEMGLQDRRWNEITAQEKRAIKEMLNDKSNRKSCTLLYAEMTYS